MGVINKTTEKINELLDKIEDAPDKIENGKTPVFVAGTTTTLDPGMSATAEVVLVGTDPDGNPQYKINIGVPKGHDGTGGSGGGVADSVQWANVLNKPGWVNSATKPTYTASEVGALPEGTKIPTKTSDLTNDKGFLTSSGFKTINGESIIGTGNITIQGGGGSSGGTGNVNVTNASSLKKTEYYVYKPSADGSLNGTFSVIPNATESSNGLFSHEDYAKLSKIKSIISLPIAFADVTSKTTQDELLQLFKTALGEGSYINTFADVVTFLAYNGLAFQGEYLDSLPFKWFIGNKECLYYGSYIEEVDNSISEFTFVSSNGSFKTIRLEITLSDDGYKHSISVFERKKNDVFYLPKELLDLNINSTKEEVLAAFGGANSMDDLIAKCSEANQMIFINDLSAETVGHIKSIPVSSNIDNILNLYLITFEFLYSQKIYRIDFSYNLDDKSITKSTVRIVKYSGYLLNTKIYTLNNESTSDDISTALGGESGLKSIIEAARNGNSFYIRGEPLGQGSGETNTTISVSLYREEINGDIMLLLTGWGYMLWGGAGGFVIINYTKSSNTFSVNITTLG